MQGEKKELRICRRKLKDKREETEKFLRVKRECKELIRKKKEVKI